MDDDVQRDLEAATRALEAELRARGRLNQLQESVGTTIKAVEAQLQKGQSRAAKALGPAPAAGEIEQAA